MQTPGRQSRWFWRYKFILAAVIIVLAAVALTWANGGLRTARGNGTVTPQPSTSPKPSTSPTASAGANPKVGAGGGPTAASATPSVPASEGGSGVPAYRMTITGSQATIGGDTTTVTGQVTNNEHQLHSATIQATFYDQAGVAIGVAKGSVTALGPGQTKTFTLTTTQKVTNFDHMVVEVSSIS